MPERLTVLEPWQLAELAVTLTELDQAGNADSVKVEHDVRLRDTKSDRPRQIDVLVRATVNDHEFLRIVEVQHRKSSVGLQQIDQWVTKARNVGAHRLTTVAHSYTKSALLRLKNESNFVQAYELRPAAPEDWPFAGTPPPIKLKDVSEVRRADFIHRRVGEEVGRYLALVNAIQSGNSLLFAVIFDRDSETGEVSPRPQLLHQSEQPIAGLRVSMPYRLADGTENVHRWDDFEARSVQTGPLVRKAEHGK